MIKRTLCILFVFAAVVAFVLPPAKKIRVYMIGDSTMCDYDPVRAPLTGWGMPFRNFFDTCVEVKNHARGGRSTRTFLSENRWAPVVDSLQAGDYVLIQFGHNDEAKEEKYKDRYTPVNDYKDNLVRFINETRSRSAIPVLITPVSRMRFDKQGHAGETHKEYSDAVLALARTYNVACVDLDSLSRQLFESLGPERTKYLFMQLEPGEHPYYLEGQKDNTHFNDFGARKIAELVLASIRGQKLTLAEHIYKPAMKK
jgi:lysophospholipase L1-like esterase